jgi:hypothetical protein
LSIFNQYEKRASSGLKFGDEMKQMNFSCSWQPQRRPSLPSSAGSLDKSRRPNHPSPRPPLVLLPLMFCSLAHFG